jgi:hypothetical protein
MNLQQPAVRSMKWVVVFSRLEINDLEMVDQICPRWNRLQQWFELAEAFRTAA